ncbi:MAG: hypothetical protein V1727_06605 [Candidatus Omnitrophota bacterium]
MNFLVPVILLLVAAGFSILLPFKKYTKDVTGFFIKKSSFFGREIIEAAGVSVALIAVAVTLYYSGRNLELSKKQISLQLRPFVSVTDSEFGFYKDRENTTRYFLKIRWYLKNFGVQPANDFKVKNDKVIKVSFSPEELEEFQKKRSSPDSNLTEKDEALEKVIVKRKNLIKKIFNYLQHNPSASFEDLNKAFKSDGVDCFGDIAFDEPTLLLPQQKYWDVSSRDVGDDYGQKLAMKEEILIYYVYFAYEGAIKGKEYSTFYIGYYDEFLRNNYAGNAQEKINDSIPLTEFHQWMERESLD